MTASLHDRVVVLTGASSGIGHATARALAQQQARLVLAARGREGLEAVAAECRALGTDVLVVPTDVVDAEAVSALAAAALSAFGRIDVWINNVGVGAVGRFEDTPLDAHRRVIESNLIGHLNGAHAVLPHFRRRGRGILINMISLGGWVPTPFGVAYTASKFGLRGFSEALRAEVSDLPGVHVCAVYPTFVDTPGFAHGANYTGRRLSPPSPLVDARTVAKAMVALIRKPRATTTIGSVGWPARLAHALLPDAVARETYRVTKLALRRARPAPSAAGNLFAPSQGHAVDGGYRTGRGLTVGSAALALAAAGATYWLASRVLGSRAR